MEVSRTVPVIVSIFILSFIMINPVYADVEEYLILKAQVFEQTSTAQPATPIDFFFEADILTDNPGDFLAVNLTGATVTPLALANDTGVWNFFDEGYGTKGAFDAAYPNGNSYTLNTTGGILGALTEPITFAAENYPTVVPFFNGTSFNDLQGGVDPGAPINLTFNKASLGGAQVNFVGLTVEDDSGNVVFEQELTVSSTSATIPLFTLAPNTDYEVFLEWSADTADSTSEFTPGNGDSGFAFETFIEFTTGAGFFFVVGGTSLPIDQTALLLAGVQSISMWMIPILAGIGIGVFVIIRRK